jgi:hypothetical protein
MGWGGDSDGIVPAGSCIWSVLGAGFFVVLAGVCAGFFVVLAGVSWRRGGYRRWGRAGCFGVR